MGWPRFQVGGLLAALFLAACGSVVTDDDENGPPVDDGECLPNERFFSQRVWQAFMGQQCYACHNPQGAAHDTDLVLVSSTVPDYLRLNLERIEAVARTERDGVPLLLLKPVGGADHGGGKQIEEGDAAWLALEELVQRVREPVICELDESDVLSGVRLLDVQSVLRKASLSLVGRLPTEDEVARAEEGGEDALDEILDEMMQEEAFYDRLEEFWNDLFLTDRYLGGSSAIDLLDRADYPESRWYAVGDDATDEERAESTRLRDLTNRAIAREALKLVSHVVRNDRPFTEVITADYRMVNPYSAKSYGARVNFTRPDDWNEWKEAKVEGMEHAGVLTSHMILNRFPTTPTNRNRARARMVFRWFLATDLLKLADRPVDSSDIEGHNPTMTNPGCSICHAPMDPVAGTFMNWDERGRYRPPEQGWYGDMRAPGYADAVVPWPQQGESLRWLGQTVAEDPLFVTATVQNAWRMLTGQEPLSPPEPGAEDAAERQLAWEAQNDFFTRVGEDFVADGYNFKTALKSLILGPWYRADNLLAGVEETGRFAEVGASRLLTPEMLSRKIEAVLGYPWANNATSAPLLENTREYRMFYGGIDSIDVTDRIDQPSGVMANVAARMANEMACRVVPREFTLEASRRRFFPAVELAFEPDDENGFEVPAAREAIEANIVWLHDRVLGETVYPGDPEVERTFALFYETWKEGKEAMADGTLDQWLAWNCRARTDFWTGEELPEDIRVERDPRYTVRAWMAVMTYLLMDYQFLYE